jgi:hypothetical protein
VHNLLFVGIVTLVVLLAASAVLLGPRFRFLSAVLVAMVLALPVALTVYGERLMSAVPATRAADVKSRIPRAVTPVSASERRDVAPVEAAEPGDDDTVTERVNGAVDGSIPRPLVAPRHPGISRKPSFGRPWP